MGKKVLIVLGITTCYIAVILFGTAISPTVRSMIQVAADDPVLSGPAAGNFTYYESAVGYSPLLVIYVIPTLIAGFALFWTLYLKEKLGR